MEIKKGYLYFVSDEFFDKANDPFLKKTTILQKGLTTLLFKTKLPPLFGLFPVVQE